VKIATLFSGIGAPEQGAKRVYNNFETVFACEFDGFARQSYEANYDIESQHFHKDVHDLDATQYKGEIDILIGGSPCQAFSLAGLRHGTEDERGQLIYQYIRVVDECRPEVIVYENVKGIMSIDNGNTIKDFVQALRDIGYHCHYGVVNTKDYGVPQNRERLFLVGFLDHDVYHRFDFAPKIPLEKRLKDVLEDDVDEKYYLNRELLEYKSQANTVHDTDKKAPTLYAWTHGYAQGYIGDINRINRINRTLRVGGGSSVSDKHCFDLIQVPSATKQGYETATTGDSINLSIPNSKTRRGRAGKQVAQCLDTACNQAVVEPFEFGIGNTRKNMEGQEHLSRAYSQPNRVYNTQSYSPTVCAEETQGRYHILEPKINVIGSTGGGHDANSRIYGIDGLSPSLMAGNNGGGQSPVKHLTEDHKIRKLTPRECLRLQDFPDTFKIVVSDSQAYKQAGNSMSVNILEMIFNQIEKAKVGECRNSLLDFMI